MTAPQAGALEACLALLTRMYNSGYAAGHNRTVEGGYVDVFYADRGDYHREEVEELLADDDYKPLAAALRLREWRPVAGHEGRYEVSSDGLIRKITGEAVGTWFNQDGYLRARLSGPRVTVLVHRAVATAFLPNPQSHPTVNHLNHRRDDNRAENLEWCSQAENLSHMDAAGRRGKPMLGRRAPSALLSEDKVREIRRTYAIGSMSHAALAQEFGVSKRAIGRCINRETYGDVE